MTNLTKFFSVKYHVTDPAFGLDSNFSTAYSWCASTCTPSIIKFSQTNANSYRDRQWCYWGDTPVTPSTAVTPERNYNFFVAEFRRTLHKLHRKVGVVTRRQLKKVIVLERAMTEKRRQFFEESSVAQLPHRVTPTLVTPRETGRHLQPFY